MIAHSGKAVSPDEFLSFHNAGFGKLLGITFRAIQPSRVEVQLQVNDSVCTRPDVVHGGAIMALADCANGYGAILNLPPEHTTATIESKTNFWGKGRGPTVSAVSQPLHIGRAMSVWRASVFRGDKQIADVTQTQLFFRNEGRYTEKDANGVHTAEWEGTQPFVAAQGSRTRLSRNFSQPVVDERWRQIFDGACAVISEKGFAKASIREIAAASEIPISTMYQYVERKEDLLLHIYEYFMTDVIAALHQKRSDTAIRQARLEDLIRTMVGLFDKHHKYIKLMFQETRSLTPAARDRVYELDASYIKIVREHLESAIEECGWKRRNAELAANLIYFLCGIWPLRYWTVGKFGQAAVADEIIDLILNGLSSGRVAEDRRA
jgi:1,4-dihydroxy-2-naphthoyl-CoA hydrolase